MATRARTRNGRAAPASAVLVRLARLLSALRWWGGPWAGLALLTAACAVARLPPPRPYESACAPAHPVAEPTGLQRLPAARVAADSALRRTFSPAELRTANACGLVPGLQALARWPAGSPRRLAAASRLGRQLAGLARVVRQTTAELACEQDRATALAATLRATAATRRRQVWLLALGLGAAGLGLLRALRPLMPRRFFARGPGVICLLAATATALSDLRAGPAAVSFAHPRNALGEIRRGPAQSAVFPSTVWAYLAAPDSGAAVSRREQLWRRWRRVGPTAAGPTPGLHQLLFGPGGRYRPDELRLRARLLAGLAAQVQPLAEEIGLLTIAVRRAGPAAAPRPR